ncbi:aminopeptidase [Legionella beliardensis]|uniref:Aminopeptidase N n=1 Tax=Legionella beliardensis TaxID=91822 RepID=A0A378I4J6_9GAMM|nr:aminopeptidase N [Legionella beliardensis]STX30109.1 aminopeptidase [Legionella beliardensis]
MPDTTIFLKDYTPPNFIVENIYLNFELYDDYALVENKMTLKRAHPGLLHLCGDELELISITLNNELLPQDKYELKDGDLLLDNCPEQFTLTIVTRIYPQNNSELSGLYRSNQLFCTQCEAEGFRRITFYLDRPDVLSIFTTRIAADKEKYPTLLSNGNLIDAGDAENGRHWVVWQDPFKKPAYLFALVAGNLACVKDEFTTCSGKKVDLRIYVEPGNEDKCAHAMASLQRCMRWDEEVYGREYDLSIFMIVAVSDFNMGAMENKGLNIFNSKYILARPDTATDQDFADVEGVVGHEYFHNWTGNRVTCRDWFQLSLKEGLTVFRDQEFSRDMNSRDVNRILDVKVLRTTQFPEDAGAMAHPVRPDSYQEINNFYTSTVYNKGAEVIRMQHTLLGKEGFRRGMDLYFERHDGQAVTIDDFVAAMEDANQVDFTQFKRWYSQAGTPTVDVTSSYEADTLTLTLTQSCPPTAECLDKQPFHIPIRLALFNKENGQPFALEHDLIELRERQQTFTFSGITNQPVISLLREFSAPIKLQSELSQHDLLALLRFETDGYAKWNAAQCLALSCLSDFCKKPRAEWQLSNELIAAFTYVLQDETLDMALRAELLMPPDFEEVVAAVDIVDVGLIESARDFYRQTLGRALYNQAYTVYQALWVQEEHAMNAQAYGQRKLRNTCLWLMMKANEQEAITYCEQQFIQAKTMSDQIASFTLLNNCAIDGIRQKAVNEFYKQWANDELVLDKWFAIQATSELPDTLQEVKGLLSHPAFSFKNPNKVRAVIGAFVQANPKHFHALDGSGYEFLTDMLIKLDAINPQVTARLATPFTRWRRYDSSRQALMHGQLKRLETHPLSRDLREIVSKSLQA